MRYSVALALALITSLPAFAQETPTEREAARDVLKKMAALEESLDVPKLVSQLTGRTRRATAWWREPKS